MKGFISYSHADYRMFCEFRSHLKAIERGYGFEFWADNRIKTGYYWNSKIENAINESSIFVLLTSPDFIASDYIYEKEIPAIKARHQDAAALVLPIVVKRCAWQMITDALQAAPTENGRLRPVSDWSRHSDGFDQARIEMSESISDYFGFPARRVNWSTR
jgi:hypothetical protein